jgi:hypothetical protein
VYLQVKVGTRRVAGIATNGYHVASTDGILARIEHYRECVVASTMEQLLVAVSKALQMTVDASVTIGVADVDGITEPVVANGQPADIPVSDGTHVPPLLVVGADVQPAVEVPRTWLAEIASQRDGAVDGRLVDQYIVV